MSSRFGTGSFPLHTDQAFKRRPPHYILLYHAPPVTSRGTTFMSLSAMDFTSNELECLRRGIWSVAAGASAFLSPILSSAEGMTAPLLRYDPCIMNPICPFALRAADAIARVVDSQVQTYIYTAGECLILDNWSTLHGRSSGADDDSERELRRISIA
jgi:alpha-ketoglutarate-dependent taurine dioxygenase